MNQWVNTNNGKIKEENHPKLSGNLDGRKYLPVPLKRTLGGQYGV